MADLGEPPRGATTGTIDHAPPTDAAGAIEALTLSQLEHAATVPARLDSLATALSDMSAAERRDLREQLRRAWSDVVEKRLTLGTALPLVVERAGGLELLAPDPGAPRVVHVITERQGFAARALADRGEAVLDVGETDGAKIRDLLAATGGFAPRLRILYVSFVFEPSRRRVLPLRDRRSRRRCGIDAAPPPSGSASRTHSLTVQQFRGQKARLLAPPRPEFLAELRRPTHLRFSRPEQGSPALVLQAQGQLRLGIPAPPRQREGWPQ